MPGCVSRILVVSVFGGCGLWFGGCKRHCRIMMYVASSTRSQLANNSPVRGWKNWEDKNLVVIYTVTTTRSHDKKSENSSVQRWRKWEDEKLVVVNFCEQYFLPLRYWIPYPMYDGSVNRNCSKWDAMLPCFCSKEHNIQPQITRTKTPTKLRRQQLIMARVKQTTCKSTWGKCPTKAPCSKGCTSESRKKWWHEEIPSLLPWDRCPSRDP